MNTSKHTSFHDAVTLTISSTGWPYAMAAGYVSGKDDGQAGRRREHLTSEADDYALGYHRGYADGQTTKRLGDDLAKAISMIGGCR